jgi:hypothetical protein
MIQKASFWDKIILLEATISCEKPKLKNKKGSFKAFET